MVDLYEREINRNIVDYTLSDAEYLSDEDSFNERNDLIGEEINFLSQNQRSSSFATKNYRIFVPETPVVTIANQTTKSPQQSINKKIVPDTSYESVAKRNIYTNTFVPETPFEANESCIKEFDNQAKKRSL